MHCDKLLIQINHLYLKGSNQYLSFSRFTFKVQELARADVASQIIISSTIDLSVNELIDALKLKIGI